MNVSNLYCNPNIYMYKNLTFGDIATKSETKYGNDLQTHFTCIGRGTFSRKEIADYAIDLINDSKPVEFLFCGCSDSSEVLDVYMALIKQFDERGVSLKKLPRIDAFDRSSKILEIAKKGRINVIDSTMVSINQKFWKYNFFNDPQSILKIPSDILPQIAAENGRSMSRSYQFRPDLLSKINFYQSDAIREFSKINPDVYKIVFCRNMASYNSEEDQITIATLLDKNLKEGSLFIVGEYDNNYTGISIKNLNATPRQPTGPVPMVKKIRDLNFKFWKGQECVVYKKIKRG